jgi:hypothetical protein
LAEVHGGDAAQAEQAYAVQVTLVVTLWRVRY